MELVDIIRDLWSRRLWLLLGVFVAAGVAITTVYDVESYTPPKLHKKSLSVGLARTQILIDAPESPIADLAKPFDPLVSRAVVYARLISSAPVREEIGRRLGVPGQAIITLGPSPVSSGTGGREVKSGSRSAELLGEAGGLRLSASASEGQPMAAISAQAPTADQAIKLANTAVEGLRAYVEGLQTRQKVAERRRVQIIQLGTAQGGQLFEGVDRSAAVLSFVGIFIAWCVMVLVLSGLARGIRLARALERASVASSPSYWAGEPIAPEVVNGNGNGKAAHREAEGAPPVPTES